MFKTSVTPHKIGKISAPASKSPLHAELMKRAFTPIKTPHIGLKLPAATIGDTNPGKMDKLPEVDPTHLPTIATERPRDISQFKRPVVTDKYKGLFPRFPKDTQQY